MISMNLSFSISCRAEYMKTTGRLGPEEPDGAYARLTQESKLMCDLWRAAIAQAIRDLVSVKKSVRIEAAKWLTLQDFWDCCSLANINGDRLKSKIFTAMKIERQLYRKKEIMRLADKCSLGEDGLGEGDFD